MHGILNDEEFKILDQILKYLPEFGGFTIKSICVSLSYKGSEIVDDNFEWVRKNRANENLNWRSLDNVQSFLLHNGYCQIDTIKSTDEWGIYVELTKKGRELKEAGNYQLFMKNKTSNTNRIMALEDATLENQHRQYIVNICIAAGTMVAGVYYISEWIKDFYPIDFDLKSAYILLIFGLFLGSIILLVIQELVKRTKR